MSTWCNNHHLGSIRASGCLLASWLWQHCRNSSLQQQTINIIPCEWHLTLTFTLPW